MRSGRGQENAGMGRMVASERVVGLAILRRVAANAMRGRGDGSWDRALRRWTATIWPAWFGPEPVPVPTSAKADARRVPRGPITPFRCGSWR